MTTPGITIRKLQRDESALGCEVHGEGAFVSCVPGTGELRTSYRHTARQVTGAPPRTGLCRKVMAP